MEFGIMSLLPPITAIVLALLFKNVFIALFTGVLLGYIILAGGNVNIYLPSNSSSISPIISSIRSSMVIIPVRVPSSFVIKAI